MIEVPFNKETQKELLEDIAIFTGGEMISEDAGYDIRHIGPEMLGAAKKIIIEPNTTTILHGFGNPKLITLRAKSLLQKSHTETIPSEIKRLNVTSNNLNRGIGVMYVGGEDEKEKEAKLKYFQNSFHLAKMCLTEGSLIDSPSALFQLSNLIKPTTILHKIYQTTLQAPLLKQIQRLGLHESDIINDLSKGSTFGFNPRTELVQELKAAMRFSPFTQISNTLTNTLQICVDLFQTDSAIIDLPPTLKETEDE